MSGFGAACGALLSYLGVHMRRQAQAIAALQEALTARTALNAQAAQAAFPIEQNPTGDMPGPVPASAATTAFAASDEATAALGHPLDRIGPAIASETTAAQGDAQALDDEPPRLPPHPPEPPPVWVQTLRAWLFGGNTIVKAGVAILFTGLAFLAKYATEQVDVPVALRLAGIGAVAVVLMGLGWRLRHRRAGYAQVLQGGAVAVLYLTLFVAFRFYNVLGAGPVFAAMVAVAALAAALAVLQDARALAVIGALGGFATPLLVSTGSGDQVALFSYYLVLDIGIAAVAWHKTWRLLNAVGFVFTFAMGSAWGVMRYEPAHLASSEAFLITFFLLFNAIALMPARRRADGSTVAGTAGGKTGDGWVNGSLLFGLPTITFALQHGLVGHLPYGTALSALALAAFYVALAMALRRRALLAVPFEACLALATVFLTLVIPFALDARSTAGAWSLEGAGLVWLGWRQARRLPRAFGYALLLFAGLAMGWAADRHGAPTALLNAYLFNALMGAAGALTAACCAQRHVGGAPANSLLPGEAAAQALLIAWASVWCLAAAGLHIDALVPASLWLAAWLVCLSAIALLYTALATRLAWPMIARPVLAHAPLLALGLAFSALAQDSPAAHGGWWAWPLALATHAVVLWRAAPHWPPRLQHGVHALGAVVLAGLGALQGRAVTAGWGDAHSAWAWWGWGAVPALLLALLLRPRTAGWWPVRALPAAYTDSAAAVLTTGLLLWTLLANVASPGNAAPLPYLPLANPLDLGIAAAWLASAAWLRRGHAPNALAATAPRLSALLLALTGFVWLNAMLIRAFHHFGGVPFELDAWLQSRAVHSGLALLWAVTALALMWWATRRQSRAPWLAGAALLAAVVLKLVLVDLSGSGTVARIVSFIGVGVLMLVIGYVAPLPAKEHPRHAPA